MVRGVQADRNMDKVERVMKMVKRKKKGDRAREGGGALGQPNSPDTVCDELCGFNLCIGGEHHVCTCVCRCLSVCVCVNMSSGICLCVGLSARVWRYVQVCLSLFVGVSVSVQASV